MPCKECHLRIFKKFGNSDVPLIWIISRTLTAALTFWQLSQFSNFVIQFFFEWRLCYPWLALAVVKAVVSIHCTGQEKSIEKYKTRIQIGEYHNYIASFKDGGLIKNISRKKHDNHCCTRTTRAACLYWHLMWGSRKYNSDRSSTMFHFGSTALQTWRSCWAGFWAGASSDVNNHETKTQ